MFPFLHFLRLALSFLRRGAGKRPLSGWCDNSGGCKILSGTTAGVSRGQVLVFFQYLQYILAYFYVPVLHQHGCGSDPGSSAVLTPGSGFQDGKNPDPGSGINIPDHISESLVTMF